MTYESQNKPENVLYHSDQGCHYTRLFFRQYIWRFRMKQSMSLRGNYWKNAPMERFFTSLKTERAPEFRYTLFTEAKQSIVAYITGYYDQVRPHQHNDGLAPKKAEEIYFNSFRFATSFYLTTTYIVDVLITPDAFIFISKSVDNEANSMSTKRTNKN